MIKTCRKFIIALISAGYFYSAISGAGKEADFPNNNNPAPPNQFEKKLMFFHYSDAKSVSTGDTHSCAVLNDNRVMCWGNNEYGQLGNGKKTDSNLPVEVSGISNATEVSVGSFHSCARLSNYTVKCWGKNDQGQLGNDISSYPVSPEPLLVDDAVAWAIAAGSQHTCILGYLGGVKCWGRNDRGQLGDGSTTNSSTPVNVRAGVVDIHEVITGDKGDPLNRNKTLALASKIDAGFRHTCAILLNHRVYCWGDNHLGQLGNSGFPDVQKTPIRVWDIDSAIDVKAGAEHTCALLSDETVQCWGRNDKGQLGVDSELIDSTHTPQSVPSLSKIKAISAGFRHNCALDNNGFAKCWGSNTDGQLGIRSTNTISNPVTQFVNDVSNATMISAGKSHTCTRLTLSHVMCWGLNYNGQLGNGTNTDSPSPVYTLKLF